MRTLVEKPKPKLGAVPAAFPAAASARVGPEHGQDSRAYLQRTLGNQALRRLLQRQPAADSALSRHPAVDLMRPHGATRPSLQRDDKTGVAQDKAPAPAAPEPGTAYFHLVVRDKDLDMGGGVLVSDLAAAKARLMSRKVDKPWTLVLAIHASNRNVVAAQAPPEWQKNAIFYDEAAINALFNGDNAFVAWRSKFGPNRVVLYGCQVTAAFEQTIADNLARGGKAPSAAGLGEGCKPLAKSSSFGVSSRREYDRLSDSEKARILGEVQAANRTWGYYGDRPVPNDQVLDYLFAGPDPGWWSKVEVIFHEGDDYVSAKPPVPYWNRLSDPTFLHKCTKAVGNLREHRPQAPTMRDSD